MEMARYHTIGERVVPRDMRPIVSGISVETSRRFTHDERVTRVDLIRVIGACLLGMAAIM